MKPSKDIFESFFFSHSNYETAEHFKVGLTTVFNWSRKFGTKRKCSRHKDVLIDFTDTQKQIVIGSLLGDGSLGKPESKNNHSYFRELHGVKQEMYLRWKCNSLMPFSVKVIPCKNNVKYDAFRFHTIRHSLFTELEQQWYKRKDGEYVLKNGNRIKIVPQDIALTPLTVSIWYFDDGWRPKNDNQHYFSTHGFDVLDVERLVTQLNDLYGLNCKIRFRTKKKLPEIAVPAISKNCFSELVRLYLPCDELSYKIN